MSELQQKIIEALYGKQETALVALAQAYDRAESASVDQNPATWCISALNTLFQNLKLDPTGNKELVSKLQEKVKTITKFPITIRFLEAINDFFIEFYNDKIFSDLLGQNLKDLKLKRFTIAQNLFIRSNPLENPLHNPTLRNIRVNEANLNRATTDKEKTRPIDIIALVRNATDYESSKVEEYNDNTTLKIDEIYNLKHIKDNVIDNVVGKSEYVQWFLGNKDTLTAENFSDELRKANFEGTLLDIQHHLSVHLCDHIQGEGPNHVVAMLEASNKLREVMNDRQPHGFYHREAVLRDQAPELIQTLADKGFQTADRHLTAEIKANGELTVTAISHQQIGDATAAKEVTMTSAVSMEKASGTFNTITTVPSKDLNLSANEAAILAACEAARTIYNSLRAQHYRLSDTQFREFIATQNYRVSDAELSALQNKASTQPSDYNQAAVVHVETLNAKLEALGFGVPCPAPTFDRVAAGVADDRNGVDAAEDEVEYRSANENLVLKAAIGGLLPAESMDQRMSATHHFHDKHKHSHQHDHGNLSLTAIIGGEKQTP